MADMLVKLYELPDPAPLVKRLRKKGIEIRRALAPEKRQVVEWVARAFSEGWASETDVAFSRQPAACFLAVREGRTLGFACYDAACRNFFGPTGVEPASRGMGVGKALLLCCLETMARQGFGYAVIGGVGPAEYYARTVGAVLIEGSEPGIYRGLLGAGKARKARE